MNIVVLDGYAANPATFAGTNCKPWASAPSTTAPPLRKYWNAPLVQKSC